MKTILIITLLILLTSGFVLSQIGVNTDGSLPNGSAMLDVKSNNKGLLLPRMSHAEISAIANPAEGLLVYCTNCSPDGGALSMFLGGTWVRLTTIGMEPIVSTGVISSITPSTAKGGGTVISDCGAAVTAKGICYGTFPNPTIANTKTIDGTGVGDFTSMISDLKENTTYYFRAYATNSSGIGYGNEVWFKTSRIFYNPTLTYGTMTDIDGNVYKTITIGTQTWMAENLKTTKYRNGDPIPNVTDDASWVSLVEGAYCWFKNDAATYKTTHGALYNWYSVADSRNIAPTGWHVATDAEWTTLSTFLGGDNVAGGKMKEAGTTHWRNPNNGSTNLSGFTALPGGYRGYAGFDGFIDASGDWWTSTMVDADNVWYRSLSAYETALARFQILKMMGNSVRCVKDPVVAPTLSTTVVSSINTSTATSGGNVTSDGGSVVIARGVCWGTAPNPITSNYKTSDGTDTGSFKSSLTGLTENTTYFVRAYATNSAGTGYGQEISFKTLTNNSGIIFNPNLIYGTMTDIDGNEYKTITIGTQTWMAENLKTTKYCNGDPIPNITDNAAWVALSTGAYCWYNNDVANKVTYGGLYNWFAVADIRNIAPVGWHVPTDTEWTTLTDFLGGENVAGGKLKEAGTSHWLTQNAGATNSSGLTALPGCYRHYLDGTFGILGLSNYFWSSTATGATYAWGRYLNFSSANVFRVDYNKLFGPSVRCVKD